ILEQLRTIGFSIFAYDYQGYGTSQGKPSEQNSYRDIDAAYHYLTTQLRVAPDRIVVFGQSVGGGPSVDLASRQPVAGLILQSTFTSAFRVITRFSLYPFDKFANIQKIQAVQCPVLVIHGSNDQTIPFRQGEELFQRAKQPKRFLKVEGADHDDVMSRAGETYAQSLWAFVRLIEQSTGKK
ncbi:MAG: alpha/beta hydrolase, partial [Kovacikia sp.]